MRDAQQTPLDPVKKKIDFESSEMSTLYASTPREALDASEVKNARSKINTLRFVTLSKLKSLKFIFFKKKEKKFTLISLKLKQLMNRKLNNL